MVKQRKKTVNYRNVRLLIDTNTNSYYSTLKIRQIMKMENKNLFRLFIDQRSLYCVAITLGKH
jgi:hypothetical protein